MNNEYNRDRRLKGKEVIIIIGQDYQSMFTPRVGLRSLHMALRVFDEAPCVMISTTDCHTWASFNSLLYWIIIQETSAIYWHIRDGEHLKDLGV